MRILHTADWHLGKNIEGHSRMDEQACFLADFVEIVKDEKIDQQIYFFVLDYLNKVRQKASLLIHPAVTFNIFA